MPASKSVPSAKLPQSPAHGASSARMSVASSDAPVVDPGGRAMAGMGNTMGQGIALPPPVAGAVPFALWGHVHALVMLAEQGSFTAAAERLALSKAAVSERIRELERAMGLPLVTRTTRSVRLTPAGQQLVDDTAGAFAHIANRVAMAQDAGGEVRGLLRITAPVALARQQLVHRLGEFHALYPQVQVELDLSDRLRTLAMEGFDLAIRHVATVPETHVGHRLCATGSVLVASHRYLAAHGVPDAPHALAQHACLHYPRPGRQAVWQFEGLTQGWVSVPVRGPFSANNSEALRDAALADMGIALVPDFTAQAALQAGALQRVLPDWAVRGAFAEHIWLVRPYAAQVPRNVQVFTQWVRGALADGFAVPLGAA